MKPVILLFAALSVTLAALTGCTTESTVAEFDAEGRLTRKTITTRDPFDKIIESTKDKTVVAWSNGWAAYIRAATATTENPTPTGEIYAGKVSKGLISMHRNQKNADKIPQIIAATHENTSISFTGITSTSGDSTVSAAESTSPVSAGGGETAE